MIVDNRLKDIFPLIDDRVRTMSSSNIRNMNKITDGVADGGALILHTNHDPIAVIVSYQTWLDIQETIKQ